MSLLLDEQAAFVREWVEYIRAGIDRGIYRGLVPVIPSPARRR